MKAKHFGKYTLFFLAVTLLFAACSKFEEGPYFSLLTVKQRLAREWKVEYSKNLESGIEHSADFEGWILSFDKGGSFNKTILYGTNKIDYNGKWEITGNNRLRFDFTTTSGNLSEFYNILRLTKKQLWLKNTYEEIHYYSN